MFNNISNYDNLGDYLPILVGSVTIYTLSIIIIIIKNKFNPIIKDNNDDNFISPRKFTLEVVVRDILIYIMSI